MRRIGTLSSEPEAQAFSDYLFTLKLNTQVSGNDGAWDIWLLDEDQLERGRSELAAFRAAPLDPRYTSAAEAARAQRDAELQTVLNAAKQHINLRERWERPAWLQMPVTILLLGLSVVITLLCEFGRNHDVTTALQVESRTIIPVVNDQVQISEPAERLVEVRRGEVWRLVTPIFIHMSPWHLIPNAMLALVLGGMLERERGSWRLLLYVLLIAVVSNLAQNGLSDSGPRFGGLSGVVYGLFGYVWLFGRLEPASGLQFSRESTVMMVVWLLLCTTGQVGNVANVCHFVGLGMGLALAAGELLYRRVRA